MCERGGKDKDRQKEGGKRKRKRKEGEREKKESVRGMSGIMPSFRLLKFETHE